MMGDMTYHTARWCLSNEIATFEVEGSNGNVYTCQWRSKHGWHCTCPAFKYSKDDHCKHIDQVEDKVCRYGEGAAWGSPVPEDSWERGANTSGFGREYICPRCGGQTRVMQYAA